MTQYEKDRQRESATFNAILEEKFHPAFIKAGLADKIELANKRAQQISGIDACWTVDGEEVFVDYKTRWSMTNKACSKLAYEMRTNGTTGNRFWGWGIYPKKTDYWVFTHFTRAADGTKGSKCPVTPDNILSAKIEIVKPLDLYKWLSYRNWNEETMKEKVEQAEKRFWDGIKNLSDTDDIPYDLRQNYYDEFKYFAKWKNEYQYQAYISVSAKKGMDEDPTNFVLDEYITDRFLHSRRFIWTPDRGLEEEIIKGHTPLALTKS